MTSRSDANRANLNDELLDLKSHDHFLSRLDQNKSKRGMVQNTWVIERTTVVLALISRAQIDAAHDKPNEDHYNVFEA